MDVLLFSDVHTASSGRFNTSHTTVALEEFVMIVWKMSSIILSPAAQAAWRETGHERWECKKTGRMVAVGLLIAGVKWRSVSVYAPDRVKPAWVKCLFLEKALRWRDELFAQLGEERSSSGLVTGMLTLVGMLLVLVALALIFFVVPRKRWERNC